MARRKPDVAADVGGPANELQQRFVVPFEYPVVFTEDAFAPANPVLRDTLARRESARRHRVLVVLDHGVSDAWPDLATAVRRYAEAHAGAIELVGDPLVVPGGEQVKNDHAVVSDLHRLFYERRLDRHAFVVAVGGGAVQDAVGWAAATAHRGLRTVRMPSTVLSQCDSGVGVKNGVNAFGVKNFLGTFTPPFAVIVDSCFLERLPRRDAIAGLAEAVKVALIRDASFFAWLEANADALAAREPWALTSVIRRCAELHLEHIATSGDPFEMGSARPLDFGHWAAHKLESLAGPEIRHGEAVAIGLLLDARYSVESGLLAPADGARIERLVDRLGLPRWHEAVEHPELLAGLDEFRAHLGGDLSITLLRGIGHAVEVHEMDRARIARARAWLAEAASAS